MHVVGEPGIGKSRLVRKFRQLARAQGFACHTGYAVDFGAGRGRDAVRTLAHRLLGVGVGAEAAVRSAAVERQPS